MYAAEIYQIYNLTNAKLQSKSRISTYLVITVLFVLQRNEIVSGGIEPTDSDCDWPSDDETEEEKKLIVIFVNNIHKRV